LDIVKPVAKAEALLAVDRRRMEVPASLVDGPEPTFGFAARGVGSEPLANELVGSEPKVQADLVVGSASSEVGSAERKAEQPPDAGADLGVSHAIPQTGRGGAVRMPVTVSA
jgi:hypothetical protein